MKLKPEDRGTGVPARADDGLTADGGTGVPARADNGLDGDIQATQGGLRLGEDAQATEGGLRLGEDAQATQGDLRLGEDAQATQGDLRLGEDAQATQGDLRLGEDAQATELVQPIPPPPMDWKRFGAPVFVLMFLTIGLVLAVQFLPRSKPQKEGETLHKVPKTLGDWAMLEEYSMSESAWHELKPDEYVARVYVNSSGDQADLSIIGGSHTGAFHNPQVCFRVQNWRFAETSEIELQVPGRETTIPASFVRLVSTEGNRQAVGIYFYSTPMGYRTDTSSARIFLLVARLTGMAQQRAYFVRFLKTSSGNAERDRKEIKQFAEQALAEMAKTNPEVVR